MSARIEPVHGLVGHRVALIREVIGLTQQELSDRLGMERSNVANIEKGRQRLQLQTIEKLAKALHVTPKHLLKGIWT